MQVLQCGNLRHLAVSCSIACHVSLTALTQVCLTLLLSGETSPKLPERRVMLWCRSSSSWCRFLRCACSTDFFYFIRRYFTVSTAARPGHVNWGLAHDKSKQAGIFLALAVAGCVLWTCQIELAQSQHVVKASLLMSMKCTHEWSCITMLSTV